MPAKRDLAETSIEHAELASEAVGVRLWRIRKVSGQSQVAYAKDIHINQNTYSTYETGARMCPVNIASAISIRQNVTLDYIYHGDMAGLQEAKKKDLRSVKLPAKRL